MITEVGWACIVIGAILALKGTPSVLIPLLGVPLIDSSAFVSRGIGVPPFQFLALGLIGLKAFAGGRLSADSDRPPGHGRWTSTLGYLVAYGLLITIAGPFLFAGLPVFSASRGLDEQVSAQSALAYSSSNIAQGIYLVLGAYMALRLSRCSRDFTWHVGAILLAGSILAVIVDVRPDLHVLFDNSPRGFYGIETARARGQFSEPSHLGVFSLVSAAYGLASLAVARSIRNFSIGIGLAAVAAFNIVQSGSATAEVGLVCLLGVASAMAFRRLMEAGGIPVRYVLGALAGAASMVVILPALWGEGVRTLTDKMGTQSQVHRFAADEHGFDLLGRTWLLGSGLGSNRTSSLLPLLLSNLGLLGTLIFGALAVRSLRLGWRGRPAFSWGLVAFLLASLGGYASIADPTLWAFMGLAASAAYGARVRWDRRFVNVEVDRHAGRSV